MLVVNTLDMDTMLLGKMKKDLDIIIYVKL